MHDPEPLKRFLRNLMVFVLIQGGVFCLLWLRSDLDQEANYLAATVDKHRRLGQTSPPRIILVGGSNLAFGIRSDKIEAATGRQVVNMGLAVHLGLDFMLNEVEGAIGPGDIVVLSPEYEILHKYYNPLMLQQIILYRPADIRYLTCEQLTLLITEQGLVILCEFVRRAVFVDRKAGLQLADKHFPYSRQGFNRWGDFTAHYGLRSTNLHTGLSVESTSALNQAWLPSSPTLSRLKSFAQHCHDVGAVVVYSFPPRPSQAWKQEAPTMNVVLAQLKEVPILDVIDRPEDQIYARDQFFDSEYHLQLQAAAQRTERLIRSLQKYIPGQNR